MPMSRKIRIREGQLTNKLTKKNIYLKQCIAIRAKDDNPAS